MLGWLPSAASGPLTWTLSNATSTAWIRQHPRNRKQRANAAAPPANATKEQRNEDQTHQHLRGRPEQGSALLYRSAGLREEDRFQSGAIPLANCGLTRGSRRHRAATRA